MMQSHVAKLWVGDTEFATATVPVDAELVAVRHRIFRSVDGRYVEVKVPQAQAVTLLPRQGHSVPSNPWAE